MTNRQPLFSMTDRDFEWSYTKGTGAGGQKRNKTSSAVHCHHKESGAHGYSESSRSQFDNKKDAFKKMAESNEFQSWLKMEVLRRSGQMAQIDAEVEKQLKNVKIETRQDGRWVETAIEDLAT